MKLFVEQKQRHRCREKNLMNIKEEAWIGMNWEISIDMYTLLCVKQIANENLLYSTENSPRCSVITQMGRKSEKEGIYVHTWLIHFAGQQLLASWRRKWQPTPVLLPRESPRTEKPGGLQSMGLHRVEITQHSIVPFREGNGNHSSILAWRIPWTEEPGGLQSMGLQRVRHD